MDIDVLVVMLLGAILIYTIWWLFKQRQSNIFRCKFFDLRSKLRDLVISGKVDSDSTLFLYLDHYLTSIIDDMSIVNLYKSMILGYLIKHKASIATNDFDEVLKENPLLSKIFTELISLLTQYSIRKHFVTLISLGIISLPIFKSIQIIRDYSLSINSKLKLNYRQYEETLAIIN